MKPQNTIYGAYATKNNNETKTKKTEFHFQPLNLITDWQRCSLTANFFSGVQATKISKKSSKVSNLLSTVVNELLENAIKYSVDKSKLANLGLSIKNRKLHFELDITCDKLDAIQLDRFYNTSYKREDTDNVIVDMLEKHADSDHISVALGLLTLKRDFNANLGLKILRDATDSHLYNVSTLIIIDLNEVN